MKITVLTDLDTLFDTRLAVAFILNEHETTKSIQTNKYRIRYKDNIGNIPYSVLKPYYKIRTKEIFEIALPTYIMGFIREQIEESSLDRMTNQDVVNEKFDVYVNTHPYDFTSEEIELFKNAIENEIPFSKIHMIKMNTDELSCEWISDNNVNMIIMYDLLLWLEYQIMHNRHINHPLLEVNGFCPAIVNGDTNGIKLSVEYFEEMKENYKTILELAYAPSLLFSVQILSSEVEGVTQEDLSKVKMKQKNKII